MNQIFLTGTIGYINELKTINLKNNSTTSVLNISIFVYERSADGSKKDFSIKLNLFGKTAEYVHKSYAVGELISIAGKLKMEEYEKDGVKNKVFSIDVKELTMPKFKILASDKNNNEDNSNEDNSNENLLS